MNTPTINHPDYFVAAALLFVPVTFLALWLFFRATGKSRPLLIVLLAYSLLQSLAGLSGFYLQRNSLPPRFMLMITPGLLIIAGLFATAAGRRWIDHLSLSWLTWLHAIRVPVEICLFLLFMSGYVPVQMTFEGWNFDILSGLTAPLMYLLVFNCRKAGRAALLVWNLVCLALLLTIVVIAILSAPTPFQQLAFEQPNIGVAYFPFLLLPAVVVPLVLLSHLAALRQLFTKPSFE